MSFKKAVGLLLAISMLFGMAGVVSAETATEDALAGIKNKVYIEEHKSTKCNIAALVGTNDADFSTISEEAASSLDMEIEITADQDMTCSVGGTYRMLEDFMGEEIKYLDLKDLKKDEPVKILSESVKYFNPFTDAFFDGLTFNNTTYADFITYKEYGIFPFICMIDTPDPSEVYPGSIKIELCAYDEDGTRYVVAEKDFAYEGEYVDKTDAEIVEELTVESLMDGSFVDNTAAMRALKKIQKLAPEYKAMVDPLVYAAIVSAEADVYYGSDLVGDIDGSGVYPLASVYADDLSEVPITITKTFEEVTDYDGDNEEMKDGTIYNIDVVATVNGTPVSNEVPILVVLETEGPVLKVLHEDSSTGEVSEVPFVVSKEDVINGIAFPREIMFLATSFSNYSLVNKADTIYINFVKTDVDENGDDDNEQEDIYDITLSGQVGNGTAMDEAYINRLSTADLYFTFETADKMIYEVIPGEGIDITYDTENPGRRLLSFDGVTAPDKSGKQIVIGSVKISGYGGYTLGLESEIGNAKCLVTTATEDDNIVEYYYAGGKNSTKEHHYTLTYTPVSDVIEVPTRTLTINIDFPNEVEESGYLYQDMLVEITGTIDGVNQTAEYTLGKDGDFEMTNGAYVVTDDRLVLNNAYTVTVSGAGYRTARYTVTMTEDKTLNFWNNVMDEDHEIEVDEEASETDITFLAGDIVKDNNINIYDLSAVVSYFGTKTTNEAKTEYSAYAKYDLNRDGIIDSKDVAYVLVSWDK